MADEEFSLKDDGILHPYVRDQRNMNVCYSYSTTEAVAASFARDKIRPPVELSVQQIADHVPIDFQYANKGKKKDSADCYLGTHIHALQYAQYCGLCTNEDYPNIGYRPDDVHIPPVPTQALKYRIGSFTRTNTEDGDIGRANLEEENLVTEEQINEILRKQPIIGAIRIYQSFQDFKGKEIYMGRMGYGDKDYCGGHSILIIGYGVKNGVKYFIIKNSYGVDWGDGGYARIRRDLLYKLCYPSEVYMFPHDPSDVIVEKKPKDNPSSSSGSKKKKGT